MKILIIGSGGREHALTWKARESPYMEDIYCSPGNAGIAQEAECIPANVKNPDEMLEVARSVEADLTIVGPEAPLVAGIVDKFDQAGLHIIGPTKASARLEGSKIYSKQFMQRYGIPTARFVVVEEFEEAVRALHEFSVPVVVKADGLAAGKGVVVAQSREEAEKTLHEFMREGKLGEAGRRVVLEECLVGDEMSFILLTDGRAIVPFAAAQDHKRLLDGDRGPNTGGMGAYSDDQILDDGLSKTILQQVVLPTLVGMRAEGSPYRGFLYCGLMLTEEGPKLLEYNVRMGDPEAQAILMRLRSDFVDILMALVEGQLGAKEVRWTPNPAVCVVLASGGYPEKPEIGKEVTGYEHAEVLGGVKIFHSGTLFQDHHLVTSGGRVMGVTASAEDLPAAIKLVYGAVAKIQFEGMHYRRDIGAKGLHHKQRSIQPPKRNPQPEANSDTGG